MAVNISKVREALLGAARSKASVKRANYWDVPSRANSHFADATHHVLPPLRAQRRVASLAAHNCGCERFRGTSVTSNSTAEAIEIRHDIDSATQALVVDTSPPTTAYVRESYQAIRSCDGPERCQVSPPLATPSTRWSKQRRQQRPDYHIVYAAQLASSVGSARRTTSSSGSRPTPANGRAHPTHAHGSQLARCPTTTILR